MSTRSADKLMSIVLADPKKLEALKTNPIEGLTELVKQAKEQTTLTFSPTNIFTLIVIALGSIGVIAVIGGIIIGYFDKTMPEMLTALGGAAVGGLVALISQKSQ
ncbi:MAG: hypothetical protein ABR958_02245 [Dehalococcoidales bacterium]